jgi:hypothetical protein
MFQKTKFKGAPPIAVDFFKDTHCNSKTGYSEDAQKAIARQVILYYDKKNWDVRNLNCFFLF